MLDQAAPPKPIIVKRMHFEGHAPEVLIKTDVDWAGCKTTHKNTRRCIIFGGHVIKMRRSTQQVVATPSSESKAIAMAR